jgi:RNA polymerase sigma factor (sigma-70 family)
MTRTQIGPVARQLQQMLGAQRVRELTDSQLLERFVAAREEDAFAAILRRHGPLVLGVCRRVLRREQDAEDAFQATFLMLARHARSIRQTEAVGGWLYRVAHRIATKAGIAMARRNALEKCVAPEVNAPGSPEGESSLRELQALLQDEVARLPEKYRAPFVMCCLEGRTRTEAARALGWKEGTVGGRVALARQLLQKRLTRRGVALAAALTALALGSELKAMVSTSLIQATAKAALAYGAGQASALSASVAALLKGGSKTMWWTKTKIAVVLVAMIGVVGACGLARAPSAASGLADEKPQADAKPQAAKGEAGEDKNSLTYGGRVLDPDGKPFAGAKLYLLYYTAKSLPLPVRATSNEEGRFRFTVNKVDFDTSSGREPWQAAMVVAKADGFGFSGFGLGVRPMEVGKKWDPADQTLYLTKDDMPVSGRILDLQGKPIAGVSVKVGGLHWPRKGDLSPLLKEMKERKVFYPPLRDQTFGLEGTWMAHYLGKLFPTATTGADGRFTIKGLGRECFVTLRVESPAIATREIHATTRPGAMIEVPGQWSVKDGDAPRFVFGVPFDFAAAPCKPIVGVVRDKDTGKPIPGAIVTSYKIAGSNFVERTEIKTVADKDGKYRLNGMPKGDGNIIRAGPPEGQPYLMALHNVADTPGLEPITADFNLKRGVWIIGKVKDKATGKPVHAMITYAIFEDNPNRNEVPTFSNDQYLNTNPINGTFRVAALPGHGLIGARAQGGDRYRMGVGADQIKEKDQNGLFRTRPYLMHDRNFHTLVEVDPSKDADGVSIEVLLDPGLTLKGTVLGPDGKPLAGALAGGLDSYGSWGYQPLKTAEFTVLGLEPGGARLLQFFHKEKKLSGSVVIKADQKEAPTVQLEPSGTLTGKLVTPEGKPAADGELIALTSDPVPQPGGVKVDLTRGSFHENRIRPDKDGSFRIEGLVPGLNYKLGFIKGMYLHKLGGDAGETIKIKAGETKKLGDVEVKPFE